MIYRSLADAVFILHFAFVLFVVFGGLLAVRRPKLAWLHLPAVLWATAVEFFRLLCPLTTLENYLKHLGGESGYDAGFIEYYVSAILYSQFTPRMQTMLGLILLVFNVFVYWYVFSRSSRSKLKFN